jgi:acyl-CoA thioesterase-1
MGEEFRMTSARALGLAILALVTLPAAGCSEERAAAPAAESRGAPGQPAAQVPRPAGAERLILAFGDSLYAGYGVGRGDALPAQLQNRLRVAGINASVVNAGVSGDTSAAGLQRLAYTLDHMARAPDLVILGLGGNDALRQIPPAQTRANMTAMMDELKRRRIPVLLTGMRAPPNLGPNYASEFEPIWPDLAKRDGAALYPFILEGVVTDRSLMQRDGVHPTAPGIARIADGLAPRVERLLASPRGPAG